MGIFQDVFSAFASVIPLLETLLVVGLVLWCAHYMLIRRHAGLGNEKLFSRQLVMLGLTLAGMVAVILALPVSEGSRNQIIALLGLLISGVFAFSSSNIFANLAAGILLRITKPFVIGDFISVGAHFGRVAERGLFDTEIQSETGELIALPNTYLTTNPVSALRSAGALVSASLSLGYDVSHAQVEPLLINAARGSKLDDAFVQILELGNFAITYRVSGVLPEAKGLITARSNLHKAILDQLHGAGIEIMSATIMNQRPVPADYSFVPEPSRRPATRPAAEPEKVAEKVLFDKAELAHQLQQRKAELSEQAQELELRAKEADGEQKQRLKEQLEQLREQRKQLEKAEAEPLKSRGAADQ
ncbi:MAG: mechanosensitive ion channel domain-containing protein [Halopseudomonas sp.]|uniref:mechanosensitive ion channel domain-containing protein n=1 Tax=Halopseudomonas sp. TaxID=2901191 RepID=UPI003001061C